MNDLSEKEQLEQMRAWWADNGRFVIGGVVLGVAMLFGWNQWQSSIQTARVEASNLFEDIMASAATGNLESAESAANELYANYTQTVYPSQARLAMARLYMDKGRDQDAADALRPLVESGGSDELALVARLRLAKILLYQNKPDDVVALLQDREGNAFSARYAEALGDAHVALGQYEDARAAYQAALTESAAPRTVDLNYVQLKLNDLPDTEELAATSAAIEAAIDESADVTPEDAEAEPAADMPAVDEAEPEQ